MAFTTTNMGLRVWDQPGDFFSYSELAANLSSIDAHDHTSTKGVQIPTGGIANLAVTNGKLAASAVDSAKIADGNVTAAKIETQQAYQNLSISVTGLTMTLNYYKDTLGIVHFRGVMGITSGSVAGSTTLATMPVGYRPGVTAVGFWVTKADERIEIFSNGSILVGTQSWPISTVVSFGSVVYRAEG